MPGIYLTTAHKRRNASNWNMVIDQIGASLQRTRGPRQRRLLDQMLRAAKANDAEAVVRSGRSFAELTRKVPPGCYFMGSKSISLPGEPVSLKDTARSLHLIHPQVYR